MGIFHFFGWFKKQFSGSIKNLSETQNFENIEVKVDNLMIDMNGIFHNSAQKIYQYGNFKPKERLLQTNVRKPIYGYKHQLKVFEDVCNSVEELLILVKPQKRLILCVDGPAPYAKQVQQKRRRFRSVMDREDDDKSFDSNQITPGTKFMDNLSKYIDWYIRKQISENPLWQNIEIIFSNEKVPSEGEAKCFKKGTKILLWNGDIKNIEDIVIGDQLIGDDGNIRNVINLVSGEDELYEVKQNNGETYVVNKKHILSLRISDHKRIYWDEKNGCWIVGFYDRNKNKYCKKQFSGLRDGEKTFKKMTDNDRKCIDCDKLYTTRENYGKHMKKKHNIIIKKMKTYGRNTTKTKEEAFKDAVDFINTFTDDDKLDISIEDYLNLNKNTKRNLYGYKCPFVNWDYKDVEIDPYLLGLWLGDGTAISPEISNIDFEIIDFLQKFCNDNNFRLSNYNITYRICDDKNYRNRLISSLKKYNLIGNKHIPKDYLLNDKNSRLKLLAGMIDTDGNVVHDGRMIRINQCKLHERLFNDFVMLSQSLGFHINVNYYDSKKYFNVTISGKNIDEIPTLIKRKKCVKQRVTNKSIFVNRLNTSIDIRPVGKGYYGINIDKNNRFLLKDFTVVHNCTTYIRNYGNNEESYCIHGADADLIMLSLGVKYSNFYILREDTYDKFNKYFVVDISNVALQLTEVMRWNSENYEYDPKIAVDDFIFICFMVGNDFLPHIPSLEIIESGIDIILSVYRDVGTTNGHITKEKNGNIYFNKDTLKAFFQVISAYEKAILENKLKNRRMYFEDEILESCAIIEKDNIDLDIDKYRKEYNKKYFGEKDIKNICHDYLKGLHWVISYYRKGVPDWKWYYPYDYAPSATYLAENIDTFVFPKYRLNYPLLPFQQLLSVLPPKSASLLPEPLNKLLTNDDSPIKEYYPDEFEIDLAGKKNDWQGVVIIPIIDPDTIIKNYSLIFKDIDEKESKRNIFGKTFSYNYCTEISNTFNSYYGTIYNCKVRNKVINI